MGLPILGSIMSGVSGLASIGMGIADRVKAKKERKSAQSFFEENKFTIPEGAQGALSSAERQASGVRLPAEDIRRAQIQESTAGGLGALQQAGTSAADVLSGISGLYQGEQRAMQGLAVEGAERYDRNQSMLRGELGRMADWENLRWQKNIEQPYMQSMARAGQLEDRGTSMIGGGLNAIGSAAGAYSQLSSAESQYQDFLNNMVGGSQANSDPRMGLQTTSMPNNNWKQIGSRTQLEAMPFIHPR